MASLTFQDVIRFYPSNNDAVYPINSLWRLEAVLTKHSSLTDIQVSRAKIWFNLTLVQKDEDIPVTVAAIVVFLQEHPSAIPEFKEALGEYRSNHPNHANRYQPLLEL